MHPLEGPRLKIRRAEREIERLRKLQDTFLRNSRYEIAKAELNPKTRQRVYRIRTNAPPPDLEWGVWVGEVAHNLRSALDGLAYQLALHNLPKRETPARQTQFPIFLVGTTKRKVNGNLIPHFEREGRRMIRDIHATHQAVIEGLQPYKRGHGGRNSPIFWLHELNNADKHRLIQVVTAKWGAGPVYGFWAGGMSNRPNFRMVGRPVLENGAKFGEAPPNMRVDSKLLPLIAFWEGCPAVRLKGVTPTLGRILEEVSSILRIFESEFP